VVFIPKRREKRVFGVLRRYLSEVLHELASHKESKIVERHRVHRGEKRDSNCTEVWSEAEELHGGALLGQRVLRFRVGLNENMIRAYIRNQENEDERYDQMTLEIGSRQRRLTVS
jgi:putative transposase